MKTRVTTAILVAFISSAALAGNDAAQPWQDAGSGFAPMLSHESYAGPTGVTVALGVKDPVEIALNAPAVVDFDVRSDTYFANIDQSFTRMLRHEAYAGPTEVTVARGVKDPVELAVHAIDFGAGTTATPMLAATASDRQNARN